MEGGGEEQQSVEALMGELEEKHQKEKEKLQQEVKEMMKGAKKSKKRDLETKALQMEYELRSKHLEEMNFLEEHGYIERMEKASIEDQEMPEVLIEEDSAQCSSSSSNNAEMNDEEREGLSKKEKARRKKEKKALKTKEKEAEKEKFREAMSNVPSSREVESAQLNKMLEKEGLVVKDVAADGHCLYRAIADQLTLNMNPPNFAESSFVDIRRHAADYMRNHPEQFAPYLCLPGPCDEYSAYCDEVENVNNAKWGGQLEISAIAACLEVPIWVYEVSKPILKMGTDNASAEKSLPIKISYHRHFYSLGEHYNSVVPIQEH